MGKRKLKKKGSNKNKQEEKSLWDKIWDYKEYILIGIVVIILIIMYVNTFKNLDKNPEAVLNSPVPVSTEDRPDLSTLEVKTDPAGALVQFRGKVRRSPAIFEKVPEGTFIIIVSLPGYKTTQESVKIEKNTHKKIFVKLEK